MNENNINTEFKYFQNSDMDRINNNYMIPIFDDILKYHKFKTILDYGCGNGIFGSYFKTKINCNLIGIDASHYGLKLAKEKGYDKTILNNDFNTNPLPLDPSSTDFVICKDILEHLLDPVFVLNETYRVLNKNGLFLIHVPHHFSIKYRLKFIFTHNIDTQNYFPDSIEANFPHIRFFTMKGLIKILTAAKFKVVKNYSGHFVSYIPILSRMPIIKYILQKFANKYPDSFSDGFTLLCKKI